MIIENGLLTKKIWAGLLIGIGSLSAILLVMCVLAAMMREYGALILNIALLGCVVLSWLMFYGMYRLNLAEQRDRQAARAQTAKNEPPVSTTTAGSSE
jgi:threonine/homoserine/homoserine lactone efflux protein